MPQLVYQIYQKNQNASLWWPTWSFSIEKGAFFFELGVLKQRAVFVLWMATTMAHLGPKVFPLIAHAILCHILRLHHHLHVQWTLFILSSEPLMSSDFLSLLRNLIFLVYVTDFCQNSELLGKMENRICSENLSKEFLIKVSACRHQHIHVLLNCQDNILHLKCATRSI